jgi:hypothetical protein
MNTIFALIMIFLHAREHRIEWYDFSLLVAIVTFDITSFFCGYLLGRTL